MSTKPKKDPDFVSKFETFFGFRETYETLIYVSFCMRNLFLFYETLFSSVMYHFFQCDISNIKALSAADDEGRTPVCLRGYNRIPQKSIIMFPLLSAAPSCRHEK